MDEKGKKRVNGWVEGTDGVNFGSGGLGKRVLPGAVGHSQWS